MSQPFDNIENKEDNLWQERTLMGFLQKNQFFNGADQVPIFPQPAITRRTAVSEFTENDNTQIIGFRMGRSDMAILDQLARESERTRSGLIRLLIRERLERRSQEPVAPGSQE